MIWSGKANICLVFFQVFHSFIIWFVISLQSFEFQKHNSDVFSSLKPFRLRDPASALRTCSASWPSIVSAGKCLSVCLSLGFHPRDVFALWSAMACRAARILGYKYPLSSQQSAPGALTSSFSAGQLKWHRRSQDFKNGHRKRQKKLDLS